LGSGLGLLVVLSKCAASVDEECAEFGREGQYFIGLEGGAKHCLGRKALFTSGRCGVGHVDSEASLAMAALFIDKQREILMSSVYRKLEASKSALTRANNGLHVSV